MKQIHKTDLFLSDYDDHYESCEQYPNYHNIIYTRSTSTNV